MTDFKQELISLSLSLNRHHYLPSIPPRNKPALRIAKGKLVLNKDEILGTYDGEK
jgi:hypothetical protein